MEIKLAKTAGFCYGVNNAIKTVLDLREWADKKIYTFGPIIHNPSMVNHLSELGVVSVSNIDEIQPPAYIVIRAHGVGKDVYDEIEKRGFTLIDATCPFVKKEPYSSFTAFEGANSSPFHNHLAAPALS